MLNCAYLILPFKVLQLLLGLLQLGLGVLQRVLVLFMSSQLPSQRLHLFQCLQAVHVSQQVCRRSTQDPSLRTDRALLSCIYDGRTDPAMRCLDVHHVSACHKQVDHVIQMHFGMLVFPICVLYGDSRVSRAIIPETASCTSQEDCRSTMLNSFDRAIA